MPYLLVGAGGHARVVVDILASHGMAATAYADPQRQDWVGAIQSSEEEWSAANPGGGFVMGMGGINPERLALRLKVFDRASALGLKPLQAAHPASVISPRASLGGGVTVMPGAVVQAQAALHDAVIVNSLALVEHDAEVGEGSHVAPGAMVLGGAVVGRCCMIGAGAVVLPFTRVPDGTLVPALTRWQGARCP